MAQAATQRLVTGWNRYNEYSVCDPLRPRLHEAHIERMRLSSIAVRPLAEPLIVVATTAFSARLASFPDDMPPVPLALKPYHATHKMSTPPSICWQLCVAARRERK
jgi:hypothetical protein